MLRIVPRASRERDKTVQGPRQIRIAYTLLSQHVFFCAATPMFSLRKNSSSPQRLLRSDIGAAFDRT
jgi:hypothetical protein